MFWPTGISKTVKARFLLCLPNLLGRGRTKGMMLGTWEGETEIERGREKEKGGGADIEREKKGE